MVIKLSLLANDCSSQLMAFLDLIILLIIGVMSCSLSVGTRMTISSVSSVRPKNSIIVFGPSDLSVAIGIAISWHTCLNVDIMLSHTVEYLCTVKKSSK